MKKNLVSIVVPTYNDEPYIRESLDDIVAQTYESIEVIIVNDGSTDNTEEILKEYCKKHEHFTYYNKKNGGTGSALNFGFQKAQGEFATWFSSDDRKTSDMIEKLAVFLKKNRDIEYVTAAYNDEHVGMDIRSYLPANNNLGFVHKPFYEPTDVGFSGQSFVVDNWLNINRQQCYQGVNFMFTMRLKNECGDYLLIPGEDYYMAAQMGLHSRIGYIDSCLGIHRNPPDALSMENRACVVEANRKTWGLIDSKYKQWYLKKVPKIAHFYWGSGKMSFLRYMTLYSFKKMNPDWSVKLYVPKNLNNSADWSDKHHRCDTEDYNAKEDYYEKAKELPIKIVEVDFKKIIENKKITEVHKSDYLRLYLLHHEGGLWSDMDILYIKSIAELSLNNPQHSSVDCSMNISKEHGTRIGVMFSSKNRNPFYGALSKEAKKILLSDKKLSYQAIGAYLINQMISGDQGPNSDAKIIYDRKFQQLKLNFINSNGEISSLQHEGLEDTEFYYNDHKMLANIFDKDCFTKTYENSIGIHWYGGSSKAQEFNNVITLENYKTYNSTVSKALEMILEKQ